MRFFNTAGPVNPADHYHIPPLERIQLDEVLLLIQQKKYFVLHAPRQTGKTTCLLALQDYLNQSAQYRALYVNVEGAQAAREKVTEAMRAILRELSIQARSVFQEKDSPLATEWETALEQGGPFSALSDLLTRWAEHSPLPCILMIDEIDALIGDTLVAVLRQLRGGYARRPRQFPQSIILCGVRDVRDYRIHAASEKAIITGGSAFNIKAESLRLGNFTEADIAALYQQHTDATGQRFEPDVLPLVWDLTRGQPWLVNALAYEVTFKLPAGRDRARPITVERIYEAKENLILRRETHLDQLADKLQEERVRRVIEPLLAGEAPEAAVPVDDIEYVRDLGLIGLERPVRIANRIYQEVIPRELTYSREQFLTQETAWYVRADGTLDLPKLLTAFQQFFRENSEAWLEQFQYREAGPQLLMQAFLQRLVNSGGRIEREYALGRRRTDLLVIWPYAGGVQRAVLELKLVRGSPEQTMTEGLAQTAEYMDRCGAHEGHLLVFDRRPGRSWEEKIFRRSEGVRDYVIEVWGM